MRISLGNLFAPAALVQVDSLIDHGEPAEGLCEFAWALHNASVAIPEWAIRDFRELAEGRFVDLGIL